MGGANGAGDVDAVVELVRLAARLRAGQHELEAHRVALGRYALVFWEGVAAERYRVLVDERRARLGRAADELGGLADAVEALLVADGLEARRPRVVRAAAS